jgi:predicted GIY-YIG superfamily endonuclease
VALANEAGLIAREFAPNYARADQMYYVYILQSLTDAAKHYTGFTTDLKKRIIKHNSGEVPHTNKYKPWKIITYTAFESEDKARSFEKYLKSHSGRTFAKKHF